MYKWFLGEYPIPFLAYIQIGVRERRLIKLHAEAEAAAASKKKQ